ncbi:unnamed protein product [Allacma fusca]|uniref:Uncharacterized protein n=1 Tax=Allacma fusca TaxID=39272 RepID=A0A8J2JAB1_9HEXA|nr:unnamed protein product [Allacma fusca]
MSLLQVNSTWQVPSDSLMATHPLAHHYQLLQNASGRKEHTIPESGHLGTTLDSSMETPRDMALLRMRRQSAGSRSKAITGGSISESIALHQRKLRETEARIDHALDLVTRSFGDNQGSSLPRHSLPRTPEVRQIRETLNKTQRIPSGGKNVRVSQAMQSRLMGMSKLPMDTDKKKQQVLSEGRKGTQASLKIYKTNPIIPPIKSLPPPKITPSKEKIDRNKVLQICVVIGNTHIYDNANPDFVNSFAKMESFKALDDSNPAGLPRFRTKIDMVGFADSEVSFQCDGKKLIITGNRPRKNLMNARKVVEVLELPAGVFPEKLRIARDREGVLNIEERWTRLLMFSVHIFKTREACDIPPSTIAQTLKTFKKIVEYDYSRRTCAHSQYCICYINETMKPENQHLVVIIEEDKYHHFTTTTKILSQKNVGLSCT